MAVALVGQSLFFISKYQKNILFFRNKVLPLL